MSKCLTNNFIVMEDDKLYCPYCGSSQLVANKKGFGAGKAITGAILTGGVGILAGFIGSGKVKVTCLKCGNKWSPGQLSTTPTTLAERNPNYEEDRRKEDKIIYTIAFVIFAILGILFLLIELIL